MSDKNTSTLQSYVDSATGAVQSAFGSVMGNSSDQVCHLSWVITPCSHQDKDALSLTQLYIQTAGEAKKNKADLEHDISHAGASVGGFSASASGVTKNDPNRQEGSWNQTIGSAKEAVGGLVGSEV